MGAPRRLALSGREGAGLRGGEPRPRGGRSAILAVVDPRGEAARTARVASDAAGASVAAVAVAAWLLVGCTSPAREATPAPTPTPAPPAGGWAVVFEAPGGVSNDALAAAGEDEVVVVSALATARDGDSFVVRRGERREALALTGRDASAPRVHVRLGPGGAPRGSPVALADVSVLRSAALPDGAVVLYGVGTPSQVRAKPPPGQVGCFLLALDPSGAVRWAHGLHGPDAMVNAIAGLPDGGVAISGYYDGAVALDGDLARGLRGEAPAFAHLGFVGRIAADGALAWLRGTELGAAELLGVGGAADGSVRVVGACSGATVVRGTTRAPRLDCRGGGAFAAAFDRDGEALWASGLPGRVGFTTLQGATHHDGAVALAGSFHQQLGGAGFPVLTSADGEAQADGFVARFDAAGAPAWLRHLRSAGHDAVRSITLDADGGVWSLARLGEAAELEPGDRARRVADGMYVLRHDAAGALTRATRVGGNLGLDGPVAGDPEVDPTRIAVGGRTLWIAGRVFGTARLTIGASAFPFSAPTSPDRGHGFVVGVPLAAVPAP